MDGIIEDRGEKRGRLENTDHNKIQYKEKRITKETLETLELLLQGGRDDEINIILANFNAIQLYNASKVLKRLDLYLRLRKDFIFKELIRLRKNLVELALVEYLQKMEMTVNYWHVMLSHYSMIDGRAGTIRSHDEQTQVFIVEDTIVWQTRLHEPQKDKRDYQNYMIYILTEIRDGYLDEKLRIDFQNIRYGVVAVHGYAYFQDKSAFMRIFLYYLFLNVYNFSVFVWQDYKETHIRTPICISCSVPSSKLFRCGGSSKACSQTLYCGEECAQKHFVESHRLECGGSKK